MCGIIGPATPETLVYAPEKVFVSDGRGATPSPPSTLGGPVYPVAIHVQFFEWSPCSVHGTRHGRMRVPLIAENRKQKRGREVGDK